MISDQSGATTGAGWAKVSLRVWNGAGTLPLITASLGDPDHSRIAGERLGRSTARSKADLWIRSWENAESDDLEAVMSEALSFVRAHATTLVSLLVEGPCEGDVWIGWEPIGQASLCLEPRDMLTFAEVGLALVFSVYGPDEEDE